MTGLGPDEVTPDGDVRSSDMRAEIRGYALPLVASVGFVGASLEERVRVAMRVTRRWALLASEEDRFQAAVETAYASGSFVEQAAIRAELVACVAMGLHWKDLPRVGLVALWEEEK